MGLVAVFPAAAALTDPATFDLSTGNYTFTNWDAASTAGTYPANMFFHQTSTQDPVLATAMTADYTGVYNASSQTRMNGLGTNGFSFINTSTSGFLGAAELGLITSGRTNIQVSWTGGLVANTGTRYYAIRLQYRIGAGGTWTDVPGPVEYIVTGSTVVGTTQNFGPTTLPNACENQAAVYLRWKYYYLGSGANNRSQISVGNITVSSVSGAAPLSAPVVTSFSPTNLWAYTNQTAIFTVSAFGNPAPQYQWQFNTTNLPGQTNAQLQVYLTSTNQSGTYNVVVSNSVSHTNASGLLTVTPKPNLKITEVMTSENTNNLNGSTTNNSDWWELSNLGTFPVNLQNCRFDDSHNLLSDAVTITNAFTIAPGESIVLVNTMTAAQFKAWWGVANLPAGLQIITYPRIGFSAAGDSVYFWNAAATNEADTIDAVTNSTATRGVSFTADTNGFNFDGVTLSTDGVNGAFTASIGGDIGSPGYLNGTNKNSAPAITGFSPTTLWAYLGQTATFTVAAAGNPAPQFQWQSNNVPLLGETNAQLQLTLTATNQSGTYSVTVSNFLANTNLSAVLTVTPKPNLHITEVMASENTNNLNGSTANDSDWWELSNLGTFPVNLQNCRFDDSHDLLSHATTIATNVTIAPGESIVLVNGMTPDQFKTWWGATNLPANLQIINYSKISFSTVGDALYFWNAAAVTESDYVDAVSFSAATRGYSFTADTNGLNFDGNTLSVSNVPPAFTAPIGNDIGSPGYISTPVVVLPPNPPTITNVHASGGGADISWTTQTNYHYAVAFKVKLTDASWTVLTNLTATGATLNFHDGAATNATRFYRITATP